MPGQVDVGTLAEFLEDLPADAALWLEGRPGTTLPLGRVTVELTANGTTVTLHPNTDSAEEEPF